MRLYTTFWFLALQLCASLVTAQLPFSTVVTPGPLTISWGFSPAKDQIIVSVSAELDGPAWLGIGWHAVGSSADAMAQADFVIAVFNGSSLTVTDRFVNQNNGGFAPPVLDTTLPYPGGVDNILSYDGYQYAIDTAEGPKTITYFQFARLLDTNDTKADHPIQPGLMKVIHAFGKSNAFGFHGNRAGEVLINFFDGESKKSIPETTTLVQWHGALMFVGVAILLSFGAFFARYSRKNQWWFWIHFTFQVSGILCVGTGFILALVAVNKTTNNHFESTHTRLGLSTVVMIFFVVPILGLIAHILRDPNRKRALIFPNMTHYWLGRLTLLLGYVTILFGMDLIGLPNSIQHAFGLLWGVYMVISVVAEAFKILDGNHVLSPFLPSIMQVFFERDKKTSINTYTEETDNLIS